MSASAVAGVPTQVSSSLMPFQTVPATPALQEAFNNTRGNSAPRYSPNSSTAAAAGTSLSSPPLSGALSRSIGFSTAFLAQFFGQGVSQDSGTMSAYLSAGAAPEAADDGFLDYNTMLSFSKVKYMPSNAAVPRPEPAAQPLAHLARELVNTAREQMREANPTARDFVAQAIVQRAAVNNASANQPQQNFVTAMVNLAQQMGSAGQPAAAVKTPAPAPAPVPTGSSNRAKPISAPASLIRTPLGFTSYAATATRNALNLTPVQSAYSLVL